MRTEPPIIIIDDDEDDQYLYTHILKDLGASNELIFFENGLEAYTYLKDIREIPLLMICDVNMPLMNGFELRKKICDNPDIQSKHIPFIFITTGITDHIVEESYNLDVQGLFVKPASLLQFTNMIKLIVRYWSRCLSPNNI